MSPKARKLLEDVRDSAAFILERTRGLTAATCKADRLVRQAVERNFEIIGEAVNRLRKSEPVAASTITGLERIIAFRNVLIHGYQLIKHDEVWNVITESLPVLLREVDEIIRCADKEGP